MTDYGLTPIDQLNQRSAAAILKPPWPADRVKAILVQNKDGGGYRLFIDGVDWSHRVSRFTMTQPLEGPGTLITMELVADEVTYVRSDDHAFQEAGEELCEIRRELAGESDAARTSVPEGRSKVEN